MIAILKRLYGFRQGRVSARKYAREQQRLVSRLSGILLRKVSADFNSEVRTVAKLIAASNEPTTTQLRVSLSEKLQQTLTKHYTRCFRTVYDANRSKYEKLVQKQVDVGVGFDFSRNQDLDDDVFAHVQARQNYITGVSENVGRDIMDVVEGLRGEGLGNDEIGRQLPQMFEFLGRRRANVIARTETHAAVSAAQDTYHTRLASRYALNVRKRWLATSDARTRSAHATMNGTEVALDDKFLMPNGTRMKHVGDPAGGPSNTINCRCVILYVDVDDEVQDVEIDRPQADEVVNQVEEGYDGLPIGISYEELSKKLSTGEITHAAAKRRNRERMIAASEDERYFEAKTKIKYRGRKLSQIGKDATPNTQKAADPIGVQMMACVDQCMAELEILAKKFGVPPIRGITTLRANSRSQADMGDGILGINFGSLRGYITGKREPATAWRIGQDRNNKPFTTDAYFDDPLEKIRTTFYHEFGHHIHQMKGLKKTDKYNIAFVGKWERVLRTNWDNASRRKKWRNNAVSLYGESNSVEWFAENFSLWAMKRQDLVSDDFKELIRTILQDDT